MSKLLEQTHKRLGWPTRKEIMRPDGAGPGVIADLARRKLETAIKRFNVNVNVGVLTADPRSNKTEDPLAIVCEFPSNIHEKVLRETHRLVWSFSRSPMLITVEPTLVRVCTCWKKPLEAEEDFGELCVEKLEGGLFKEWSLSAQAAKALQWVELASGSFFRKPRYSKYFHRDQRADQLMLEDLRGLRQRLLAMSLPQDICHDLLARVIFIEFLFQRKDSQGYAALNEKVLASLQEQGVLSKLHKDLASILESHEETYQFFRELNDRFNGDLFPGKGETAKDREKEWRAEMEKVKGKHLNMLAEFVRGEMEMTTSQRCLWKRYAFDVIPLEFISSIYEEFVSGKKYEKKLKGGVTKPTGIHYTPGHVVDLILDQVLPWNSKKWNIRILDPACGSGIFLVKAYQRLVHRWKRGRGKPGVGDLRSLLVNNLFGVDKDHDAVRVASFSLYLAMCDEIDPKHVWQKNVWFPRLREKRLITSDFFEEDKGGFRSNEDKKSYDLVIGNAPWGRGSAKDSRYAKQWARRDSQSIWPIPNMNLGPLFLVKATGLIKDYGRIALLQPAGALLFNRDRTATEFRRKFFSTYKVEQVINLAALRLVLFPKSNSPACAISMRGTCPDDDPITYIFPKRSQTKQDSYRITVESHDMCEVYVNEATSDPFIWTALAWGGRRDLVLMRKLSQEMNLEKLSNKGMVKARRGVGRGQRTERQDQILNMRLFDAESFPEDAVVYLNARELRPNLDPFVYKGHSTSMEAFKLPQMIVKLSWRRKDKRFRALIVDSNEEIGPVLCSFSYVSVHVSPEHHDILEPAYLAMNSKVAVYYTLLSSGQFAFYIPKPTQGDLLRIPVPSQKVTGLNEIVKVEDVDDLVRRSFEFNEAEWVLIEDLFDYTLPDFKGGLNSPGRRPTRTAAEEQEDRKNEPVLTSYCEYFIHVLRAGFGEDKKVSATIFTERNEPFLSVRLVGIHLDTPGEAFIKLESIDLPELIQRLKDLDKKFLQTSNRATDGNIFYQRVARIYDTVLIEGRKVPTIFIVKPDQIRYWTRSIAMRDADEIARDIMLWREGAESKQC